MSLHLQVIPIEFGTPEFDDALRLRVEVLRKPLGLQYTAEQISAEYNTIHLAAYDQSARLVGYLNLVPLENGELKMRQVAVAPDVQGKGVGRVLVEASEEWALRNDFSKIVLHARDTAIPFYLKLGYSLIGDQFEEVGIPHHEMEKVVG